MPPVRRHAWRALPVLVLLAIYWPGLTNWFYQDDFGWLNLRHEVHSVRDLGPALFAPKAHGNMRPLGENAYFLILSSIFGVDAVPFRVCAFVTQIASLLLLGSIVGRMTGSRAAGLWAQILWIVNPGLAPAMCWSSIYNQILSGFFFLLAFYLLLRDIESGEARFYIAQWAAFVLGIGALETNVMYPAIAAAYAFLFARPYLKKIVPMFLVSALAILIHMHFAPLPREGVYAVHFDSRMFATLWTYWSWALGPSRLALVLLSCATAAAMVWKRSRMGWFGVAWFVIVLGPYLPLSEHKMDYYLAVPTIGLAILGGWALTCYWRARVVWRMAALACVAVYLAVALPAAWKVARWHHARGARAEDLVLGVAAIRQAQPGKIILLDGVDTDLFWSAIADAPFRAMAIPLVYLVPGAETRIEGREDLVVKYTFPAGMARRALEDGRAVVYKVDDGVLRNVTAHYRAMAAALWKAELPRFINLGDPAFAEFLGTGWDECVNGYRSMQLAGTVRLGGPRSANGRLYVTVFHVGALRLGLLADGEDVPIQLIRQGDGAQEFGGILPDSLVGKDAILIQMLNPTREPLRFGFVEIR